MSLVKNKKLSRKKLTCVVSFCKKVAKVRNRLSALHEFALLLLVSAMKCAGFMKLGSVVILSF